VRHLRGYSFNSLKRGVVKIPDGPGVYIWRYWPTLNNLDEEEFLEYLSNWCEKIPIVTDEIWNSRLNVTIKKSPFGTVFDNDYLFGLSKEHPKVKNLLNLLSKSESNRLQFAHALEIILANSPPIYIGKADNLQRRLVNHFNRDTSLLSMIEESGIDLKDIYIAFIEDAMSEGETSITTFIEEILQRIVNPPLTKRIG